jgi:hypothetical protein
MKNNYFVNIDMLYYVALFSGAVMITIFMLATLTLYRK